MSRPRRENSWRSGRSCVACRRPADLSPFAQALHYQWGMTTAGRGCPRRRREEDANAAVNSSAQPRYFDLSGLHLPSGQKRGMAVWRYFSSRRMKRSGFARPNRGIHLRPPHPDDQLVCQLGIGSHVDHVLVRRAVDCSSVPRCIMPTFRTCSNRPRNWFRRRLG
jgi:hypothetical protein